MPRNELRGIYHKSRSKTSKLSIESPCHLLGHLVQTILKFRTNHHFHYHIEFYVQHHTHARVVICNLFELYPHGKVKRRMFVSANLNEVSRLFIDHAKTHRYSFHPERTFALLCMPIFNPTLHSRCKIAEIAYYCIYLFCRTTYLMLLTLIFFHNFAIL